VALKWAMHLNLQWEDMKLDFFICTVILASVPVAFDSYAPASVSVFVTCFSASGFRSPTGSLYRYASGAPGSGTGSGSKNG